MKLLLLLSLALLPSFARAEDPAVLMKCTFRRSMSTSFGYSYVYTVTGKLKDLLAHNPNETNPYWEVDGAVTVAVDKTASTNTPGAHLGSLQAQLRNHIGATPIMLDLLGTGKAGPETFRLLVLKNAAKNSPRQGAPSPSNPAYEMDSIGSPGISGSCTELDPRLQIN